MLNWLTEHWTVAIGANKGYQLCAKHGSKDSKIHDTYHLHNNPRTAITNLTSDPNIQETHIFIAILGLSLSALLYISEYIGYFPSAQPS